MEIHMKKLFALLLFCSSAAFAQTVPQVTLSWGYVDTDVTKWGVTGFQMQRKAEACVGALPFTNLAVIGPTLRAYVDAAVVPATTYCYQVLALAPITVDNPKGNSNPSNMAEKRVTLGPPPVPANLLATFVQAMIDALETLKTSLLDLK